MKFRGKYCVILDISNQEISFVFPVLFGKIPCVLAKFPNSLTLIFSIFPVFPVQWGSRIEVVGVAEWVIRRALYGGKTRL